MKEETKKKIDEANRASALSEPTTATVANAYRKYQQALTLTIAEIEEKDKIIIEIQAMYETEQEFIGKMIDDKDTRIASLEAENERLKAERVNRLAYAIIPGLMARYGEPGYKDEDAINEAFVLAFEFIKAQDQFKEKEK